MKRRPAKHCSMLPWLTARQDGKDGRFLQVGNSFWLSRQVLSLSYATRWMYLLMCLDAGGKAEVTFTHGRAEKLGISSSSYDRAIQQLIRHGFISRADPDNLAQFAPNRFRFVNDWKVR